MFGIFKAAVARRKPRAAQSHQRSVRRLDGFEPLEKREVLSASGFAGALPSVAFDAAIRGTGVQYSEQGLPASMEGDIYTAANAAGQSHRIGRYHEALQPILMDVNGDQVPDFVGTTGVATFSFFVGAGTRVLGSITTVNTSYIQGFTPAGEIVVGSQGTITAGTGVLRHVAGGFVSQSTVAFAPTFQMQTAVHFNVTAAIAPAAVDMVMGAFDRLADKAKSGARGHDDAPAHRGDHAHQAVNNSHHHEVPGTRNQGPGRKLLIADC